MLASGLTPVEAAVAGERAAGVASPEAVGWIEPLPERTDDMVSRRQAAEELTNVLVARASTDWMTASAPSWWNGSRGCRLRWRVRKPDDRGARCVALKEMTVRPAGPPRPFHPSIPSTRRVR